MGNLPTNIGISKTFVSLFIGQHLSDASHDLVTLTLNMEVTVLVGDSGHPAPSVYQV